MRRTEQLQGLRLMKFEEIYERARERKLSQVQAAEILGVSERTFRRWRDRFEAEGAEGLFDRRLGRAAGNRVPVDAVMEVLELFDTRYRDFTARHFYDKLVETHDFKLSYNRVRITLQAHGRIRPAPRRGAHRRKRPRRPIVGMMLHQDGSSHEWVSGQWWDLIVTMEDATNEVYSAFFVAEEGTMSSFQGIGDVIEGRGLFCSLYADRGSHYWHTPEAGGKVDKDNPTQVGRALEQLGIELIAAYSPQARGRSERMFGTLQNRLPQELRLNGITTMDEANRFLKETFLPAHNARFARPAEDAGSAFVPFAATCGTSCAWTSCASRRIVSSETTIQCATRPAFCKSRPTGTGIITSRRRFGCMNIQTAHWPSSTARAAWPATMHTAGKSARGTNRPREPLRRARSSVAKPPVAYGSLRLGHRADNRSGQLAWYLNRSIQFVIDSVIGAG